MADGPKQRLEERLAEERVALVVGAGFSMNICSQAPSWRAVIEGGIERCVQDGLRDAGWADALRGTLETKILSFWLTAAEEVEKALREGRAWRAWLADTFGRLKADRPQALDALVQLRGDARFPVLTTNYDDLIHGALKLAHPPVTWDEENGQRMREVLAGEIDAVCHLHGRWNRTGSVIFGRGAYEEIVRKRLVQFLQQTAPTFRSLVFIGFGQGGEDPNFSRLLEWIREGLGDTAHQHYCLVREGDEPIDRGIVPVVYGDDYDDLAPFLRELAGGAVAVREATAVAVAPAVRPVPNMAETPADGFVERRELVVALRAALLHAAAGGEKLVALKGAGGFGKTTLAQAVCHDPEVIAAFSGGILWATLGEAPGDLTAPLMEVARTLDPELEAPVGQAHAARLLRERLGERRCLLVVDDVWSRTDAEPFLGGGPNTVRLLTTRDSACLPPSLSAANRIDVDAMEREESADLLARGLGVPDPSLLDELAKRLGRWPLLLGLVNAELRLWMDESGLDLGQAIARVEADLDRHGLVAFDAADETDRNRAAGRTLELSFARLGADRRLFEDLAVFGEDADIPIATIAAFWDMEPGEAARKLRDFRARSLLLRLDGESCRLHDVVRHRLRELARERLPALHRRVVEAYGRIAPDLFLFRWGAPHLAEAGEPEAARLMSLASLKSAHVLARFPDQCANQLLGRLRPGLDPVLDRWREAARQAPSVLRLSTPTLIPADHPLRMTLEGHGGGVNALAVLADGRLASGSWDRTIRIWDPAGGGAPLVLEGHGHRVNVLAVLADGRLASSSADQTIRIWDSAGGGAPLVLEGHGGWVSALAVLAGGRLASGSWDRTIRIWDARTGACVGLVATDADILCLAALPDGGLVAGDGSGRVHFLDVRPPDS